MKEILGKFSGNFSLDIAKLSNHNINKVENYISAFWQASQLMH